MKATTEVTENKGGLFSKHTWTVTVRIEFSELERTIIKNSRLDEIVVYDQIVIGNVFPIQLREVMKKGIWNVFQSAGDAAQFRTMIETQTLPSLKQAINASGAVSAGAKTLEF